MNLKDSGKLKRTVDGETEFTIGSNVKYDQGKTLREAAIRLADEADEFVSGDGDADRLSDAMMQFIALLGFDS